MCNPRIHANNSNADLSSLLIDKPIVVKTIFEKPDKQVDLSKLSSDDIASLRKTDPFTFYSIPAARAALMHGKSVNLSMPKETTDGSMQHKKSCLVKRQTRVSCESYPDFP